mgnify:CR=1 FL=1
MRSYRRSIWTNSSLSLMLSAALGLMIVLLFLVLSSLIIYFFLGDMNFSRYFSLSALITGGYTGSFFCEKYRRRRGIAEGALCGLIMYVSIAVCGAAVTGSFIGIKKLLLLAVSGAAGGAVGVNSKRPKNLRE